MNYQKLPFCLMTCRKLVSLVPNVIKKRKGLQLTLGNSNTLKSNSIQRTVFVVSNSFHRSLQSYVYRNYLITPTLSRYLEQFSFLFLITLLTVFKVVFVVELTVFISTSCSLFGNSRPEALLKILQNSQENTSAKVSVLIKLQASACNIIKIETLAQVSCDFCKIFKNTCFYSNSPLAAPDFYKSVYSSILLFSCDFLISDFCAHLFVCKKKCSAQP